MLKKCIKKIKKAIFKDFLLNILSSILVTFSIHFLTYPYLSRIVSSEKYGMILLMMGCINAIGVCIGNSLNNTRILMESEYEKKKISGDYNLIFISCCIINAVLILTIFLKVIKSDIITTVFAIIISLLVLFRSYYSVGYRIIINYKKNLYSNLVGVIGYLLGLLLTHYTGVWLFPFILGEFLSCIYIYRTVPLVHEPFKITVLMNTNVKKLFFVMFATIFSVALTYMDRFFIYPVLGPEQVTNYTVAAFLGKTFGIIMTPVSGVLLTYYVKETKLLLEDFYKRLTIFLVITICFYFVIYFIQIPMTKLLYPTLASQAIPYVIVANISSVLFIFGNTLQPTLLRFCGEKWLTFVQGLYFAFYLIFGYFGMKHSGLKGFCYGMLLANTLKILIVVMIVIYTLTNKQNENKRIRKGEKIYG